GEGRHVVHSRGQPVTAARDRAGIIAAGSPRLGAFGDQIGDPDVVHVRVQPPQRGEAAGELSGAEDAYADGAGALGQGFGGVQGQVVHVMLQSVCGSGSGCGSGSAVWLGVVVWGGEIGRAQV